MTTVRLVVGGVPRTKKTSNVLARAGARHIVLPSKSWRDWVATATLDPVGVMLPAVPWNCRAHFYREANRGDAVGFYQGLADLLEKRGVLPNDRWIVSWDGSRMLKDAGRPRVEVELTTDADISGSTFADLGRRAAVFTGDDDA